ncbi:MAG: hypothetical protein AB8C84_04870 [Oligoflexales bacterium]
MGHCQLTVAFQTKIENSNVSDQETVETLEISPEILYQLVTNLRNDLVSEMDDVNAEDFSEAMMKASEVNKIVEKFESVMVDLDEDDE